MKKLLLFSRFSFLGFSSFTLGMEADEVGVTIFNNSPVRIISSINGKESLISLGNILATKVKKNQTIDLYAVYHTKGYSRKENIYHLKVSGESPEIILNVKEYQELKTLIKEIMVEKIDRGFL